MSHLFLPYVAIRDAWLFEGLPTYLQYVLMVRGGAIDSREGWSRLIAGFQRGARAGTGLSLAQASQRVTVRGNYLRVYWAGAAMMLDADLRLREISQGRHSLDTALAGLAQCCLAQQRRWSADELVATLDRVTGTTVFGDVAREQFESEDFPDFKRVLVRAGVTVKDGDVVLDPGAPGASWREALMRPLALLPR
jgi:predicted metalloprotease with PDZ domain